MSSLTGTQIAFVAPAPVTNGTSTSNEAAARIEPAAGTLRAQALDYIRACGEIGATDEEIQLALSMNPSTQRPRRQELEKLGMILRTSRTRPTRSGRSAVIFIATYEVQ